MTMFGGYKEQHVEPQVWRVEGRSNGVAGSGVGRNIAVYRAAEIMKAAGFSYFRIVDQKGQAMTILVNNVPGGSAGESMVLWIRGTNDPAALTECRAKNPASCATLNVETVLTSIKPQLVMPTAKH